MKKAKQVKKGGPVQRKPARVPVPRGVTQDKRALALAKTLSDPCNAPLEPGCYPGQTGFITRFSGSTQLATGAAQSAFVLAVNPASYTSYSVALANDTTVAIPSFTQVNMPGPTFVNANCRSIRCLGACFEFFTNATPLNAQGTFYYGVVPHSIMANGFTTIAGTAGNLQHMSKVNADAYELKWRPGVLDDQFTLPNANLSSTEWDDKNTLVLMGAGFPASTSVTVKITLIIEWLPANNLGLATPATGGSSPVRAHQVVAAMDAAKPNWWAGRVGDAARFIWSHGGQQLAAFGSQLATRSAARMLLAAV